MTVLTTREQLLRALGNVFDRFEARRILLQATPAGIAVDALIAGYLEDGSTEPLERLYATPELVQEVLEGIARRGSGATAGPLERDLRVIGRLLDDRCLSSARVLQGAHGWIIEPVGGTSAPDVWIRLDRPALDRLERQAVAARASAGSASAVVEAGHAA